MKKSFAIFFYGMSVVFPIFSAACSEKNGSEVKDPGTTKHPATITVTPESLTPDCSSQTLELVVTADVDWSVRPDESWISVKPSGGIKNEPTILKVSVEANKEFETRHGILNIISGSSILKSIDVVQGFAMSAHSSVSSLLYSNEESQKEIVITSNGDWTLTCDADWLNINPNKGGKGETEAAIKVTANNSDDTREATISLNCGDSSSTIKITQLNYNVTAPEGYSLVWNDEFDYNGKPNSDWVIENQGAGWVNNELQTYTSREIDGKLTLEVKDGFLYVNCFKGSDGKVYSGRMNAKPSTGWKYGYVEARINLPKGKGTWPAFWMMPSNVDWTNDPWPYCGEIDIMEEVGCVPNEVSSSVHTGNYNHTKNTQKTHAMTLPDAEGAFHIYACEWDEEKLITYVDGKVQLSITKSALGSDHASWPFDRAFYPIVNLAWGGDWGGMYGVDEAALPVTMIVDYVRVFQKK